MCISVCDTSFRLISLQNDDSGVLDLVLKILIVRLKIRIVLLKNSLVPVLCVDETLESSLSKK